ncbi:MAG: NUDIX hydrolase [Methylotenera sp.]|jgi:ADP-ribose pyrophosphatase YjhB (NUDIX family)|uniref:NUDIX hydrolase n=1 Tax=Methylotenera sp. TaxID=2051956 RepID=UPI0027164251|nr:NUDIX hydrolase [Methylotenera sp.]MDO9205189.1 NUDIX hydrolase [Methylotenera sp.]MDO9393317.1 NUDIX hydrolase [Methylotenera sp.]MDP1521731.1 NUDIX hydrolase [Methylotenera sp.]MDP2230166.1 NUDIX hydrolase [Methylotenera sp.]MDP3141825.1 NUDIX hydrolase [Methylotenera sp.]
MQWKPHATVAAIVEDNGKFLLVEETTDRGNRFNQPAGHLEDNETLIQAVIRETLEETAYIFNPESLLGVYHWKHEHNNTTYLRFAFIGNVSNHQASLALDEGIIRAVWMTADEIRNNANLMRSPQVITCIEDYLCGQKFPLEVLTHL